MYLLFSCDASTLDGSSLEFHFFMWPFLLSTQPRPFGDPKNARGGVSTTGRLRRNPGGGGGHGVMGSCAQGNWFTSAAPA